MKKILVYLITAILCLSMIGCSNSQTETTKYESLEMNNTIIKDFCEISFTNKVITKTINEKKVGLNLEETNDNVWIVFLGSVKNLSSEKIDFLQGLQSQIVVDNKYKYPTTMTMQEMTEIVPLKTVDFALYSAVPEEVISSCEKYVLQIGFNDEFTIVSDIGKTTYKYEISGSIDEYGSESQIQNFQTFSEFVTHFVANDIKYNEKFKVESFEAKSNNTSPYVNIKNGNCLKFVSNDKVEINFIPYLQLTYNTFYEYDIPEYGKIRILANAQRNQDNGYHYISADKITIKSSAGEIIIGDALTNTYTFNNVTAENDFIFDSKDLSLEKLYSIVNKSDCEIIFDIKIMNSQTLENEQIELSYICDNDFKDTMIELLDIYRQMPNASMGK